MGLLNKMYGKLNMQKVIDELDEAGIAKEEIKTYNDIMKDSTKIGKMAVVAQDRMSREYNSMKKLEKNLKKMRKGLPLISRMKYARIFFWSKEGRYYRNLKRQLKRAKSRFKFAERTLKVCTEKHKSLQKKLKQRDKYMREMWDKNKTEIKLVKLYNKNDMKLEAVFGKEGKQAIDLTIKYLQKNKTLPLGKDAQSLYLEIDKAITEGKTTEFSLVKMAKDNGVTFKELLKVEEKELNDSNQNEEKKDKEQNNEQEMEIKNFDENEMNEYEEGNVSVEQEEEEYADEFDSTNPYDLDSKEQEDDEKIITYNKFNKKRQEHQKKQEAEEELDEFDSTDYYENNFKKELRENAKIANSSLDRKAIEEMQKESKEPELRKLTAEQYLAFIGCAEYRSATNGSKSVEDILKEINENADKQDYIQMGIDSLEKGLNKNKENGSKISYKFAEKYKEIQDKKAIINDEEYADEYDTVNPYGLYDEDKKMQKDDDEISM